MATPLDPYTFEWCEIRRWRGYVKSTFYAVTDAGEVLAESRPFRWRKAESQPETPAARAAYDAVVGAVIAEGWIKADETPPTWYGTQFTRARGVPLVSQVATPVFEAAPAFEAAPVPASPSWPAPRPHGAPAPRPPAAAAPSPTAPEPAEAPVEQMPLRHRHRRTFAVAGGAVVLVAVAAAALPAAHKAMPHSPTAAAAQTHTKPTHTKPTAKAKARASTDVVHHRATAAKPVAAAPAGKRAPALVDVRIMAHGNGSWIELRRRSAKGPELYRGTLAAGKHLHFRGARLWASFGAAGNLSITANGRPVELRGTYNKLFVP